MANRIITDGAGQELSAWLDNIIAQLNGEDTSTVSSSNYTSKDILSEETGRVIAGKLDLIVKALKAYNAPSFYGTCATAASTTAKAVVCTGFKLKAGRRIVVKFTSNNTAAAPTLNVNGTGAKAIKSYGTTAGTLTYRWQAGSVVEFVYDGTYWLMRDAPIATSTVYGAVKATTLNGSVDTAPSFYAPTSAGTKDYVLKSNGSGPPVWVALSTISTDYELPEATTTVLGGVMLCSDTVQTVAANAVSSASSRTYAVQENSNGQLVVNVPWVNTTYSTATTSANGLMSSTDKQKADRQRSVSVTISTSSWSNKQYKATAANVTASNDILVVPDDASAETVVKCGIKATAQAAGGVTFTCTTVPTASVTLKVIALN